jgi:hypothetical protein
MEMTAFDFVVAFALAAAAAEVVSSAVFGCSGCYGSATPGNEHARE